MMRGALRLRTATSAEVKLHVLPQNGKQVSALGRHGTGQAGGLQETQKAI